MRAYPELKGTDRVKETCTRCAGYGRIEAFGHIQSGICFECNGAGGRSILVSSIRAREARWRKQAEQARELRKKAEQIWEGLRAGHNAVWHVLKDHRDHQFVASVASQIEQGKFPSQNQLKALAKFVPEETKDEVTPVPEGRHQVTGRIVSTRWVQGYRDEVLKMLVEDDQGYRVWGSMPKALWEADAGDRVQFTAALEQSRDDRGFGFFKRPTKPERV